MAKIRFIVYALVLLDVLVVFWYYLFIHPAVHEFIWRISGY